MPPGRHLFVLGGGGSAGAYQVGALVALAEAGIVPDALFGCSAGALNAAFLAIDPSLRRAEELAEWWTRTDSRRLLSPGRLTTARGMATALATRAGALLDERPLRRLVEQHVGAHDLSELAVPLTVTTTCLDCADAVHVDRGPLADVLVASCALPGLFPPVLLPDGHRHVDGGVLNGVPVAATLAAAGPDDVIHVLDCGFTPVTGKPGACAATADPTDACGLGVPVRRWTAPVERSRSAVDVVLRSFTIARAAANRAAVLPAVADPRVRVLPHVADAWATGLLEDVPTGPRDFRHTAALVEAGRTATAQWLAAAPVVAPRAAAD